MSKKFVEFQTSDAQFRCSRPGSTFDTQAKQLLRLGNTGGQRRYSKSHEGGDFVWFLYLIRICVWPLGGTWIRYQQLFIPDRPVAEGRGIHNINNIRCRRSSQPRTMINIAFCFQAWGFQFLYKPRNLRTENAKSLSHTHRFLLEAIILG